MWSSFTIASPDPPATVRDRLAAALARSAPGWLSGPTTFRGEVSNSGFRVIRNLARLEKSFAPIVATGRITPAGGGTAIEVATRPQWHVVFALCVWSALWGQLLWPRLVYSPLPGGIDWCEVAALVAFVTSGWVVVFTACTIEERDYQTALAKIFTTGFKTGTGS